MKTMAAAIALTACLSISAQAPSPESKLIFTSSDSVLQSAFDWAKAMALSYSHGEGDPVGPWCEAALPQREAFCIRDVCHQSIGAHLLGLTAQNKNMMDKFVGNISQSRDLCTFWELDRHDRPAPIDYRSDEEFWYNLNANFDIIHTAWKLYNWTADADYISRNDYTEFYRISLDGYLDRWMLRPDNIMDRKRIMNRPESVMPDNQFYACRGIPSYVESEGDICAGLDLIASIYAGHAAAAKIAAANGSHGQAKKLNKTASKYRKLVNDKWWDAEANRFNTSWTENQTFSYGEGIPFALWFGITDDTAKVDGCVNSILSRDWNIENMSYFPAILFDNGYPEQAYDLIGKIPSMPRSEYPEVSFGMIEALIRCGMGIAPETDGYKITTEHRIPDADCVLSAYNIPLFDGHIDLTHNGKSSSEITNNTSRTILWTPILKGKAHDPISVAPGKTISISI